MLSIGFRCVLDHFGRFQVCVILRVGMRVVSEIRLCSLTVGGEQTARACCRYLKSGLNKKIRESTFVTVFVKNERNIYTVSPNSAV